MQDKWYAVTCKEVRMVHGDQVGKLLSLTAVKSFHQTTRFPSHCLLQIFTAWASTSVMQKLVKGTFVGLGLCLCTIALIGCFFRLLGPQHIDTLSESFGAEYGTFVSAQDDRIQVC